MENILDLMDSLNLNKDISRAALSFLVTSKLDSFMLEDTLLGAEEISGSFITEKDVRKAFRYRYFMDVYQLSSDSVFTITPLSELSFDSTTLYYLNTHEIPKKLMLSDLYKNIKYTMDDMEIKQIIYRSETNERGILFRNTKNEFMYFSPDEFVLSRMDLDFIKHKAYSPTMDFSQIYVPDLEKEYYYFNYNLYLDSPVKKEVNKEFLNKLQQLINSYTSKKDEYRKKAFITLQAIVKIFNEPITEQNKAELFKRKGVGSSSQEIINDFLKTGTFKRLNESPEELEKQRILKEFNRIYGIGNVMAMKLYQKGYRSLKDLELHKNELTRAQQIGLKYSNDLEKRISRTEIDAIKDLIGLVFKALGIKEWQVMGSYLREAPDSGDIDILVKKVPALTMDLLIDRLLALDNSSGKEFILERLAQGEIKFLGIVRLADNLPARRMDIFLASSENWATYYLYATGSKSFNEKMRSYANKKGFSISEYAVTDIITGQKYPVTTEKEIFELIDLPYVEPFNRN